MTAENTRETPVGVPWQPGQSGNPGGRPKGLARMVRDKVGTDGAKLVEVFWSIASDKSAPRRDRMLAAAWLADRGFGKAVAMVFVEEGGARHPMMDLSKLSTEELHHYAELVEKARPGGGDLPVIEATSQT